MKHKFSLIWRVAVALVLVLSFSLVTAVPAMALEAEVWVDGGWSDQDDVNVFDSTLDWNTDAFATIKLGVAAVADFGTVNVRPGTYDLGITGLTIDKDGVTLQATGTAAETIIDATGVTEGNVSGLHPGINIAANGVTVDGFTVKDADGVCAIAVNGAINAIVKNNIITSPDSEVACGILIAVPSTRATVSGNELDAWNHVIVGEGTSDCTLSGNTFGRGIELQACSESTTDFTITDNIIIGSAGYGILLDGWGSSRKGFDEILIEGNTISGTTLGTFPSAAISFCKKAAVTNLTITGNDITNNLGPGIGIQSNTAWGAGNTINNNNIFGNVGATEVCSAIENQTNTSVDAENNWWGVAVESAIDDMVSTYVDYSPWLTAPYPDGTSTTEDFISVSLYEGWNLVSLPLYIPLENRAPATLLADVLANVDIVWGDYDPTTGWKTYDTSAPTNDLTSMRDGKGYWVKMTAADTLDVSALGTELPSPPEAPPSYGVLEGWNLIGFKSVTEKSAEDYLGTAIAGATGTFETMYGYNAVAGTYTTIQKATKLVPGHGYWLAVNADGTIYP